MTRNKSYDETAVLNAAMHSFRAHGYGGVSIKHLERATGLKSGSIYNGFGDKDGVFRAALAHYNATVVRGRLERHLTQPNDLAGLKRLFLSLLHEPGGTAYGCLLTNTAIEFANKDAECAALVREGFDLLKSAFSEALAGHQRLRSDVGALKLLALYQGILVLIRLGLGENEIKPLIDAEFDSLEAG